MNGDSTNSSWTSSTLRQRPTAVDVELCPPRRASLGSPAPTRGVSAVSSTPASLGVGEPPLRSEHPQPPAAVTSARPVRDEMSDISLAWSVLDRHDRRARSGGATTSGHAAVSRPLSDMSAFREELRRFELERDTATGHVPAASSSSRGTESSSAPKREGNAPAVSSSSLATESLVAPKRGPHDAEVEVGQEALPTNSSAHKSTSISRDSMERMESTWMRTEIQPSYLGSANSKNSAEHDLDISNNGSLAMLPARLDQNSKEQPQDSILAPMATESWQRPLGTLAGVSAEASEQHPEQKIESSSRDGFGSMRASSLGLEWRHSRENAATRQRDLHSNMDLQFSTSISLDFKFESMQRDVVPSQLKSIDDNPSPGEMKLNEAGLCHTPSETKTSQAPLAEKATEDDGRELTSLTRSIQSEQHRRAPEKDIIGQDSCLDPVKPYHTLLLEKYSDSDSIEPHRLDENRQVSSSNSSLRQLVEVQRERDELAKALKRSEHRETIAAARANCSEEELRNELRDARSALAASEAEVARSQDADLELRRLLSSTLAAECGSGDHELGAGCTAASLAAEIAASCAARREELSAAQRRVESRSSGPQIRLVREALATGTKLWRLQQAQRALQGGSAMPVPGVGAGGSASNNSSRGRGRPLYSLPPSRKPGDDIAGQLLADMTQALRELEASLQ